MGERLPTPFFMAHGGSQWRQKGQKNWFRMRTRYWNGRCDAECRGGSCRKVTETWGRAAKAKWTLDFPLIWVELEKKKKWAKFSYNILQLLLLYCQNPEVARELKMKTLLIFFKWQLIFYPQKWVYFLQVCLGFSVNIYNESIFI